MQQPSPKLLLIEHDPQFAYLLQRYADKSGCQLILADSLADGLALAQREPPALMLVGMLAAGAGDDSALQAIKADPTVCRVPVIICSSLETPPSGWEEEVDALLVKPIQYADFLAALIATGVLPGVAQHDRCC